MKKVITFGVFDYFHLGHLRLFKQAKEHGDYLIVAVQDGECTKMYKPDQILLYSTEERKEIVSAIRLVDEVVEYKHINCETIKDFDFDVLCLGEDHNNERFRKIADWCIAQGKEVVRLKRTPGICSTQIREILLDQKSEKDYCKPQCSGL